MININDLEIVLVILLILSAIAIIINSQRKKKKKIRLHEYPDVFYDRYFSVIDPIEVPTTIQTRIDHIEETEKRQLIGSLVESIRIKKQAKVVGIREQLPENKYKHTYDVNKAFSDPETLDNTVEEPANIKDYKIPSDAQVNTLLGAVLPEIKEEEPKEPEDYLRQFIFKDGKWVKNTSK